MIGYVQLYFKLTGEKDTYYAMFDGDFGKPLTRFRLYKMKKDLVRAYTHFDKIVSAEFCSKEEWEINRHPTDITMSWDDDVERKTIYIQKDLLDHYNSILRLTGNEIYDKYGLKRDETFSWSVNFGNGIEADIRLVVCEGEDKPYTECVLYKDGCEVFCSDACDYLQGEWELLDDKKKYVVQVCAGSDDYSN